MQTQRRFDLKLSLEDYIKIIKMKTGALFRIPCVLSAKLNLAPLPICEALQHYGETLGIAYQIYDDCLDLVGTKETLGKTLGTDLDRGKVTLPILLLLAETKGQEHEDISETLINGTFQDKSELLNLIRSRGLLKKALEKLGEYLRSCRQSLELVRESPARASLLAIPSAIESHVQDLISD